VSAGTRKAGEAVPVSGLGGGPPSLVGGAPAIAGKPACFYAVSRPDPLACRLLCEAIATTVVNTEGTP